MKSITTIILLLIVLQSCNNTKFEHTINTNVWELTIADDGNYDGMHYREIEFYNLNGMLIEKKYFFTDKDEAHQKYSYNEKNQLIEYELMNSFKIIFFYENDLVIKKEFYSSDNTLSRYNTYEYSDSLLNFTNKYGDEGNLYAKVFNYYTDDRLDSTLSYSFNETDSVPYEKKKFSYDNINNTTEEELWYSRSIPSTGLLSFARKIITGKDSENRIIFIEYRDIENQLQSVNNYKYDLFSKKIKQDYYSNDSLRYYYTANYSEDDKNLFLIPEIFQTWF